MELVVLRARAVCESCRSKLPPRTEAWQDGDTGRATCVSCERFARLEVSAAADPAPAVAPRATIEPPEPTPTPTPTAVAPPVTTGGSAPDGPPAPAPGPARTLPQPVAPTRSVPPVSVAEARRPATAPEPARTLVAPDPAPAPATAAERPDDDPPPTSPDGARRSISRLRRRPPTPAPAAAAEAVAPAGPVAPRSAAPRSPSPDAPVSAPSPVPVPAPVAAAPIAEVPADRTQADEVPADEVVAEVPAAEVPDGAAVLDPAPATSPAAAEVAPATLPEVHHPAPPPTALGQALDDGIDERRARSVTSIIGRLRTPGDGEAPAAARPAWPFDRVDQASAAPPTLDPEMTLPLDRGEVGEGRVGQTLEGARIHGLEVLHGLRIAAEVEPIDHLVVAVNGVWVIRAVPVLTGKLERRDVGDWFTADPRLHIDGDDHSDLVAVVRRQVEAVTGVLAQSSFSDLPIRGVLCFGSVQPGWVAEPFVIDGISVTWRRRLVEPLLDPVLVDLRSRTALVHALAGSVVRPAGPEAGAGREAGDPSEPVAG